METSQINGVIDVLEDARKRKHMFLKDVDPSATINWLNGFMAAVSTLTGRMHHKFHEQAYRQRGWEFSARGPWVEMQERGLEEDAIVDELFALEILAWHLR